MTESMGREFVKEQLFEVKTPLVGELRHSWGWLLALGILFIILGTIGLGMSVALTVATVLIFGFLLSIGGAFQIIHAFKCKGWKSILLHIWIALLYIAAGVMLIAEPIVGSFLLTAVLGGILAVVGILRIVMGLQLKSAKINWGWTEVDPVCRGGIADSRRHDSFTMASFITVGDRPSGGN